MLVCYIPCWWDIKIEKHDISFRQNLTRRHLTEKHAQLVTWLTSISKSSMAAPILRSSAGQVLRSASAIVSKPVSGSHVLRIDGYSHLKEAISHGEGIESCDFDIDGHIWRLLCYPNDSHSKYRRHIALYLTLVSFQDEVVPAQS